MTHLSAFHFTLNTSFDPFIQETILQWNLNVHLKVKGMPFAQLQKVQLRDLVLGP